MGILFPIFDKHFGKRLKALMTLNNIKNAPNLAKKMLKIDKKENDMTNYEKADFNRVTRSINSHLKMDSCVNIEVTYIKEYCEFFNCSYDYFFGLIDYPTHEYTDIIERTGLSMPAIDTLMKWCEYQKNMEENAQNQTYFPLLALNVLLSDKYNAEFFLQGFQDLLQAEYKIPAYHIDGYDTVYINEKYSACAVPKCVPYNNEYDVIKGENGFSDIYKLTLLKDKEKPWDNVGISLTKDFFETIALEKVKKYLLEVVKMQRKGSD